MTIDNIMKKTHILLAIIFILHPSIHEKYEVETECENAMTPCVGDILHSYSLTFNMCGVEAGCLHQHPVPLDGEEAVVTTLGPEILTPHLRALLARVF